MSTALGSISGTVFSDVTGNNLFGGSDTGLSSITVVLLDSNGNYVALATTNSSGAYNFAGVAAGSYSVAFVTPSGYVAERATALPVTVANQAVTGVNAGFYAPAMIAGYVYTDANGNGSLDGGEALFDGYTVNLLDANGNVVATTISAPTSYAPHGVYVFSNVKPGTYSVQVMLPGGATPVSRATGQVVAAQTLFNFNVGLPVFTASITGTVFTDANADGLIESGDTGLAGAVVTLTSAAGKVVATATTASNGQYTFTGLAAGTYAVTFAPPSTGTVASQPGAKSVIVAAAQAVTNVNAGFYTPGSIAGTVFYDPNANGVQDASEVGLGFANDTVTLTNASKAVVATTTTDSSGHYSFANLAPGTYAVSVQTPSLIPGAVGSLAAPASVTVAAGQAVTNVNDGFHFLPSISGGLYNDVNGDGIQEYTEGGAPAGAFANLYDMSGKLVATTAAINGGFTFNNVNPGSYQVQAAYPNLPSTVGPQPLQATGPVTAGNSITNISIGIEKFGPASGTSSVSGTVFGDTDGNGTQGASETGLAGASVMLIAVRGQPPRPSWRRP